jgi:hypothetical protein
MSEIEAEIEELFPPRAGGMVDSARKARTAQQAPQQAAPEFDGSRYDPVKVQLRIPEVASASTVVVAAAAGYNSTQRLTGEDGQRYWATVMTLDEPVVLCFSEAAAHDPRNAGNSAGMTAGGFALPVNTPLPIQTSAEIWVAATSSTPTRVSFYRQSFAG